jgi:hypothetical protein
MSFLLSFVGFATQSIPRTTLSFPVESPFHPQGENGTAPLACKIRAESTSRQFNCALRLTTNFPLLKTTRQRFWALLQAECIFAIVSVETEVKGSETEEGNEREDSGSSE